MTRFVILVAILVTGCASNPPPVTNVFHPPPPAPPLHTPASLDEGLAALQLVRVELPRTNGGYGSPGDATIKLDGRKISLTETAGWSASPTVFARRASDNAIVLVRERAHVTYHDVKRGCLTFAGGRAWFETATYELAPHEQFGGTVIVPYEKTVEVPVYSPTQPDGSPCPPPAID
jgi:hypothetical protein